MGATQASSAEQIVAISSLCVAALAFAVTLWQGYLTRKHNRLSVQPRLRVSLQLGERPGIYLQNVGFGPAVIIDFLIALEGSDAVSAFDALDMLESPVPLNVNVLAKDDTIAPSEKITVLELKSSLPNQNVMSVISEWARLYISIEYASLYGQKMTTKCSVSELL